MNRDFERLIDGLLDGITCGNCYTELAVPAERFTQSGDGVYTAPHSCGGCEVEYEIEVKDTGQFLIYNPKQTGEKEASTKGERYVRKETLHRETHPIRTLVEGFNELKIALAVLRENRRRVKDLCETFRQNFDIAELSQQRVNPDIHNYLAGAYSFNQILETVMPNLPEDGLVEDTE